MDEITIFWSACLLLYLLWAWGLGAGSIGALLAALICTLVYETYWCALGQGSCSMPVLTGAAELATGTALNLAAWYVLKRWRQSSGSRGR